MNEEMDEWLKDYVPLWNGLSGGAKDVLICLVKCGPTWDGDVPSKRGRDELLEQGMASKIVLADNKQGYQAATYKGAHTWRAGTYIRADAAAVRAVRNAMLHTGA